MLRNDEVIFRFLDGRRGRNQHLYNGDKLKGSIRGDSLDHKSLAFRADAAHFLVNYLTPIAYRIVDYSGRVQGVLLNVEKYSSTTSRIQHSLAMATLVPAMRCHGEDELLSAADTVIQHRDVVLDALRGKENLREVIRTLQAMSVLAV